MPDLIPKPNNSSKVIDKILPSSEREHEELFLRKVFGIDPERGIEILFRTYYTPLCSHAVRFVYSKQIAEDLVSEVFLQFFRTHAYKEISSSYSAYLFRSVRNEAFTYLRREFGRTTSLEGSNEISVQVSQNQPDMEVHFNHLLTKISETVAELPIQCRRVFIMSRFEDMKYKEIAQVLKISPKTVEVHISKALRHLRQNLKDEWLALFVLLIF